MVKSHLVEVGVTSSNNWQTLQHSLVAGFNHLETYESQWEGLSHILWKIKKCSKPPTSHTIWDKIYGSIYGMNDLSIFFVFGGGLAINVGKQMLWVRMIHIYIYILWYIIYIYGACGHKNDIQQWCSDSTCKKHGGDHSNKQEICSSQDWGKVHEES